jgi:hypothetical protein
MSNEEIQLIERLRAAGDKLIYAPTAYVNHLVEPKRLTRDWFRRRSAWQAVSDFMLDPKRHAGDVGTYWAHTVQYFNALPPHQRTIRGFVVDTDDPDLFRWQLSAVYMMTYMTLAGFDGVPSDARAP